MAHWIHGAGIYANIKGVYWWDPCYHIYSSTMDPSWVWLIGCSNWSFLIGCCCYFNGPYSWFTRIFSMKKRVIFRINRWFTMDFTYKKWWFPVEFCPYVWPSFWSLAAKKNTAPGLGCIRGFLGAMDAVSCPGAKGCRVGLQRFMLETEGEKPWWIMVVNDG